MTGGDLILTVPFQEIPVRIVQREKDRVIPLVDIARALGCGRNNLTQIIKNNEHLFKGFTSNEPLPTHGGIQPTICLTRDGVTGILMKIHPSRAKNQEYFEKIVRFQQWAIRTLGQVMDGRLDSVETQNKIPVETVTLLEEHLRMAQALTQYAGVKQGIACAVAIAVVQERTGEDLTWCKNLLPAATEQPGYLTPTEIGLKIGLSARRVNELLFELGFQVKDSHDGWRISGPGRFWGEEFPFSRHGHAGYQIRWKPAVIGKIEERLRGMQQLQQQEAITEYLC